MGAKDDLLQVFTGKPNSVDYGYLNNSSVYLESIYADNPLDEKIIELVDGDVDHARFLENFENFLNNRRVFKDPNTGNSVSTYWANTDQLDPNSERLVAIITTWTSSMETNGGNRREYATVAAMNPEVPFVVIDNPGSGFSDKLPSKIMDYTKRSGEFDQASGIITRALAADNIYPRVYMGVSSGGRFALGAARSSDENQVERIGVIDPPGQSELSYLGMARRMFGRELAIHAPEYNEATADPYAKPHESFETPEDWEKMVGPKELGGQLRRNNSIAQKFIYIPLSFTRGQASLRADIEAALQVQSTSRLDYFSPEKSEILKNKDDPIRAIGSIALESAKRVRIIWVPEATHYFTAGYPQKVGAITRTIIE